MMSIIVRAALLMAFVAAAAACGTARAAVPVERPALEVPPVPPRNVEPVLLPPAPPPEPVPDLPPPTSTAARAKPVPPATAKPDPKAETPPVEPAAPPPAPTPPLRTPGTPDADEATRRVREISRRAQNILDNTDYGLLSRERKAQYDNAKLLITQTDAAIKVSNFEFARNLAEKAERLARELQGR